MMIVSLQLLSIMCFKYVISNGQTFDHKDFNKFKPAYLFLGQCLKKINISDSLFKPGNTKEERGGLSESYIYDNFDFMILLRERKITLDEYETDFGLRTCIFQIDDEDCPTRCKDCLKQLLNFLKNNQKCLPSKVTGNDLEFFELFNFPEENDECVC
ncbi:uncharacterized protein LOC126895596 [Daktulosphaira vitifoliae]|uniref:uncharacterized protein LOC126895596 n=1 Tax=Daktulosphaira vitifoliae TaxID=58002 RepID=UPI0021AA4481|nr:uncharacterized protein LOC126895596 [Daktulosphaira vitifoliae]XP_050523617.1 uncharacterized protein LOC126895596 [Daktulosphaira vitifoliae]